MKVMNGKDLARALAATKAGIEKGTPVEHILDLLGLPKPDPESEPAEPMTLEELLEYADCLDVDLGDLEPMIDHMVRDKGEPYHTSDFRRNARGGEVAGQRREDDEVLVAYLLRVTGPERTKKAIDDLVDAANKRV